MVADRGHDDMAQSTTPILLTGGLTALSDYMQKQGVQWKVLLATGIAAAIFSVAEPVNPPLITGVAWLVFLGSMIAPRKGSQPPIEVFLAQWNAA